MPVFDGTFEKTDVEKPLLLAVPTDYGLNLSVSLACERGSRISVLVADAA